eukprot:gene445-799_t
MSCCVASCGAPSFASAVVALRYYLWTWYHLHKPNGTTAANLLFAYMGILRKFPSTRFNTILRECPVELTGQLNAANSWPVKFIFQGQEKEIIVPEDSSLLEVAEKHFSNPPSSCRSGVCSTCCAKILTGKENIKLAVHGFTESIINAGFVCSCQTYAIGPGVTILLDQSDEVYEEQYGQYEQSYEMKFGKEKGTIKKEGFLNLK